MARHKRGHKSQMVREAFEAMGHDASPKEVMKSLKDNGMTVTYGLVTSIKNKLNKGPSKGRAARKAQPVNGSGVYTLLDIEAIRTLSSRLGAENVKKLVDAVS